MHWKRIGIGISIVTILIVGIVVKMNTTKDTISPNAKVTTNQVEEILPQKPQRTIDAYYPMAKDIMWTYEVGRAGDDEMIVSVDFIKENVFQVRYAQQDQTQIKVYVEEQDAIYEVATVEDSFIKRDYTLLRQYKNPILKLPLEKGTSWTLQDGAVRTITEVDKVEDTPMGELKTIEVTTKHEDYKSVDCYAEKIGLVKTIYQEGNHKIYLNIKTHNMNNPIKTYIDVYYPNKVTEKLGLIKQYVSIMTNEEPIHFLTDVLSIEPGEQFLQPLPPDCAINQIYVEPTYNVAYVDLSKGYEESEYTTLQKQLAIESIVQTIGKYYGVDQVTLTINGKTYKD